MCEKSSTFARNFVKQSSTKAYKHSFFYSMQPTLYEAIAIWQI